MIKYGVVITLLIAILSCSGNNNAGTQTVKFKHYQLWLSSLDSLDLKDSTTFVIERAKENDRDHYILKSSIKDSLTAFDYSINGDSIFYQNLYCPVLDSIELEFKGKNIRLLISDYDEVDSVDEESYLFWNSEYGLLGLYNWTMGPVLLFEPSGLDGFSKVLYDYVVERESQRKSG